MASGYACLVAPLTLSAKRQIGLNGWKSAENEVCDHDLETCDH
jgi:hypothetical protein